MPLGGVLAMAAVLLLGACGSDDEKEKIEGDRISVLAFERTLKADPRIANMRVRLPRPYVNEDWPQAGGYPDHAMHHLKLGENLKRAWSVDAGYGSSSLDRLMAQPVTGDGKIFVLDAELYITAFNIKTGKRLWRRDTTPEEDDRAEGIFGGGLAYSEGRLFVTTALGYAFAFDADDGAELWRYFLGRPLRGAPTVDGGRVFVGTYDNQLHALDAQSGQSLWSHEGISEPAGIMGAASPAVSNGLVIVPYSSGEIYALRVENGRVAWSDALSRTSRLTPLSSLNDIDGNPVVDRNRVYAASHGGRMVAIDLRTGERIWESNVASTETPWLAGDFIFIVTSDAQIASIYREDGRVRWVTKLPEFEDEEDQEDPIQWFGPVLGSDRLIITSSHGLSLSISPYTGEIVGEQELPDDTYMAPIIANETLFILTDDADLVAMR